MELVEGKHPSLNFPKGVFMTKARSGADDEISIEAIRKMEKNFFESHPFFNHCLENLKHAGYENLMNCVEQLSLNSMKSSLPKVKFETQTLNFFTSLKEPSNLLLETFSKDLYNQDLFKILESR